MALREKTFRHVAVILTLLFYFPPFALADEFHKHFSFVTVSPGKFLMGSEPHGPEASVRKRDEVPHEVEITKPIEMGIYSVTQGLWKRVGLDLPKELKGDKRGGDLPVTYVSWEDAHQFIRELEKVRGDDGYRYRLPTEAEREFSARGGMAVGEEERKYPYFFGKTGTEINEYAWTSDNCDSVQGVGKKKPNPLGLYDMYGNVFEWVMDIYKPDISKEKVNPVFGHPVYLGMGVFNVLRGGAWSYDSSASRSAERGFAGPKFKSGSIGFRLVRIHK